MDQEVMTIIQNVESLIQQLKQAAGGSTESASEDVTPEMLEKFLKAANGEDEGSPMDEEEDKKEEMEDVEKSDEEDDKKKVEKSDEGPTASDKADERAEENPTEDKINEVAKAIAKAILGKKTGKSGVVRKSDDKAEVYKVIKSLAGEVLEMKRAMNGMIEGLGIAEQLTKEERQVVKSRPMNSIHEIEKSLDALKEIAGKKTVEKDIDNGVGDSSHYVAKSLSNAPELLTALFSKNAKR